MPRTVKGFTFVIPACPDMLWAEKQKKSLTKLRSQVTAELFVLQPGQGGTAVSMSVGRGWLRLSRDKAVCLRDSVKSESQHAALPDAPVLEMGFSSLAPLQVIASTRTRRRASDVDKEDQWSSISLSVVHC